MRRTSTAKEEATVKLVSELKQSDDFARAKIIEKIISAPSESVVKQVVTLLEDRTTSVRMDALEVLKKIGGSHIEAIIGLLDHENQDVRVYGCEILTSLKDDASIPYLIKAMDAEDENVRNAAVLALGEFNDERAVTVLLKALGEEQWIAFSAICGLGKIGSPRAIPALLKVFRTREEELALAACEVLLTFKDEQVVDKIVHTISRWRTEKENLFVRTILEQGDEKVFQKLADAMGDRLLDHLLSYIRTEKHRSLKLVEFLLHFRHPDSAQAVLDVLKQTDPDGEEYNKVLHVFAELKDVWEDKVDYYLGVEDYQLAVLKACALTSRRIDEKRLLSTFRSASLQTRRELIKQLSLITRGSGYELVGEALHDADGHIQGDAVTAAGVMGMKKLTKEIVRMAKSGFVDVRTKALEVLVKVEPQTAVRVIQQFVRHGTADDKRLYLSVAHRIDAETNFAFLKKLIYDDDARVRQTVVRVIGSFLEHEKYVGLFKSLLKDGEVPQEVLKVIGEKKLAGFTELLKAIFLDTAKSQFIRYHALLALSTFADNALFPTFVSGLKDKNNLIKIGSLKALSELNDPRAALYITPFTKSSDEDVKMTAKQAIARLTGCVAAC